jgi:predicted RNA polymerase sigma factor
MSKGQSTAEITQAFAVPVRTVHKRLARLRAGGRAALANRASDPGRQPGRLSESVLALIVLFPQVFRMTALATTLQLGPAG